MKENNVRNMLLNAGIPSVLADIAIPFMWFIPGAVDPDSPSIIEINRGMQRSLKKLGYRDVQVNGVLDRATAQALDQISPPAGSWMQKSFVQIYGDIERAKKDPEQAARRTLALAGFGEFFEYRGPPPGPIPSWRAGTPPGPLDLGSIMDAGVELSFGPGIRDKSAMVPIPRRSGITYTTFVRLQRVINRLLSANGEFGPAPGGRIGEDGVIGSGTHKAFRKVQDAHFQQSFPGDQNSAGMAAHASTLAAILEAKANELGVAAQANKGSTVTQASLDQASTQLSQDQALALAAQGPPAGESMSKYLLFLAAAGGVAWYAASKRKKKR